MKACRGFLRMELRISNKIDKQTTTTSNSGLGEKGLFENTLCTSIPVERPKTKKEFFLEGSFSESEAIFNLGYIVFRSSNKFGHLGNSHNGSFY
jgi:hypothetical protein